MKDKKPMDYFAFWQSKYEYYKTMLLWVVIASGLASVLYFASDCYLLGGFNTATLIPRLAIMVPLTVFLVVNKKCNNYKIMMPMAYVVAHSIMWCTIWACANLTNLDFAAEGFVIVNYVFMAVGIAAPVHMAFIAHGLLLVDIIIANTFIPYPEFSMMMLLGIPSFLGICAYNYAVERSFKDQYLLRIQMEESAIKDSLTGVYNRKIMAKLVNDDKQFLSGKQEISVMMFDLDFFKKVNDTYGHDVGDQVLVGLCSYLKQFLAEEDKLIRWGGEEFIIVTNHNLETAASLAEQIRKGVEETDLFPVKVTISMGVAQYKNDNYENTIKAADEALYRAKELGRNRVETKA